MLWGVAYRLTGNAADADDIVQETFVRAMEHQPLDASAMLRSWLVRITVNLGLDVLRRRKRCPYVGPWLPSPIETGDEAAPECSDVATTEKNGPEGRYALLESVTFAFLLVLEALSPRLRAVLLLRDVFDYSARETADVLDLSEVHVRVLHHRARLAMQRYDRERCVPTRALQDQTRRVLEELLRSLGRQDATRIEALLADAVRTITDGGGEYTALRVPLVGRSKVTRFHLRVTQRRAHGARSQLRMVNGLPAVMIEFSDIHPRGAPRVVFRCDLTKDGHIKELHSVLASRKLTAVQFDCNTSRLVG